MEFQDQSMNTVRMIAFVAVLFFAASRSLVSAEPEPEYIYPRVQGFGKVVQLKYAEQQPREGSRIVVDLIKGGDPTKLNAGVEKVARYVNIYAGAGEKPAHAEIAVVLHGDATLVCLKPEIYSQRFQTKGNPNAECIQKLRSAGVKFYVCGQSLIGKGQRPEDVEKNVEVTVSALTSLVNLQADGYAYIPLGN